MTNTETSILNPGDTNRATVSPGGKSKVERYKWTLRDAPGTLMMLDKNILRIDPRYQRNANEAKIKTLANDWSWLACGALIVAHRAIDGQYYLVDGQHRACSALRRVDIFDLPCIVFETDGAVEEATGFLAANTQRKPITGLARYRALLMTKDAPAMLVDKLIAETGRVAADTARPGTVRCFNTLLGYATRQPEKLTRLWPVITQVTKGHSLQDRLVDGLLYIELNLPDGQSLTDPLWKERLLRVGCNGLLEASARFAAAYTRGGAKVWAHGMVEAMNKTCRIRMTLKDGQGLQA